MKPHIVGWLAVLTWLVGSLYAQVRAPKLGIVRYGESAVRPIYGIEANLVIGRQMLPFADAVSFSDFGGLVAVKGRIQLISPRGSVIGEYYANERKPLLDVQGALTTAIAYLPSREALLHWTGRSFVLTQLNAGTFSGTATSVQMDGAHSARLLATTARGHVSEITISLVNGQLTSVKFLPGIRGPAFLHQSFVLFHDRQGLGIEAPNGNRRTLSLGSKDFTVERMSSDWLHLTSPTTKQSWIVHLNSTVLQLSEMPLPPAQREGNN
jgi:hypothetical protein